tara:strand:+ start:371 stop:535 length:165 start_codon:yes stop_codon:yes gene_type:complete
MAMQVRGVPVEAIQALSVVYVVSQELLPLTETRRRSAWNLANLNPEPGFLDGLL